MLKWRINKLEGKKATAARADDKPKVSKKIIIKEYLDASNFFLEKAQTKYLNAILDKIAKRLRHNA